jgi:hypothetical protein
MEPMNNNSSMPSSQKGSAGGWITIIIILLVLGFGAWYLWGRDNMATNDDNLQTINDQSSSDDAASIEADLKATDTNNPGYNLDEDNFTSS